MAQKPNIPKRQSGKPSKILMCFALVIAFSLPYILVKKFPHNKNNDYIQQDQQVTNTTNERIPQQETSDIQQALLLPQLVETPALNPLSAPADLPTEKPVVKKKPIKTVKDNEWQVIKPRSGDSMATIFHRLGLSAKNLHEVLQKNPHAKAMAAIKPTQELQFLINKNKLEKLIMPVGNTQSLTIYRSGSIYKSQLDFKKTTTRNLYVTAIVKGSLYTTAQRLNVPYKLIRQMTEIFNKEIDFSHGIRSGDRFSIIYDAYYIENKMVGTGEIVAVSYTNQGKTVQAIKHVNAHGDQDYYTPTGNSLKKAFSRYPIKFSHISSTFALSRAHPILHYKRAHKGIDLAAPIGTPIQATGDGVIAIIDRHNGYGNMIKIKHDSTYSSIYGHMLKFQKGLSKGSKVKRGQVIGYVGQTGLATGPHCHYEVHVNNQPKNPTTIGLPTAPSISSREMPTFKAKAGTLLARLKSFEAAHLAAKNKKGKAIG